MRLTGSVLGENQQPVLWPLFDACDGLPLALIRGAESDVLARATAKEMLRRRPDLIFAEVPDRGHIPFLDEAEGIHVVTRWLDDIRSLAKTESATCFGQVLPLQSRKTGKKVE